MFSRDQKILKLMIHLIYKNIFRQFFRRLGPWQTYEFDYGIYIYVYSFSGLFVKLQLLIIKIKVMYL